MPHTISSEKTARQVGSRPSVVAQTKATATG